MACQELIDLAWAAGFYEGEGSCSIKHVGSGYYYAQVSINSTDEDIIRRWVRILDDRAIRTEVKGPYLNGSRLGKKPYWMVNINGFERPQAVIAMFWPWLGHRRRGQAYDVLRFARENWQEHRDNRRKVC